VFLSAAAYREMPLQTSSLSRLSTASENTEKWTIKLELTFSFILDADDSLFPLLVFGIVIDLLPLV
jgi:hypothetical protein